MLTMSKSAIIYIKKYTFIDRFNSFKCTLPCLSHVSEEALQRHASHHLLSKGFRKHIPLGADYPFSELSGRAALL